MVLDRLTSSFLAALGDLSLRLSILLSRETYCTSVSLPFISHHLAPSLASINGFSLLFSPALKQARPPPRQNPSICRFQADEEHKFLL